MFKFLQPWFGAESSLSPLLLGGAVTVLLGLALVLWLVFGRGPRRRRALHQAQRLLQQGHWNQAQGIIRTLQAQGKLTFAWQGRLWKAEGQCRKAAAAEALKEKKFEEALEHAVYAAHLLKQPEIEARGNVIEAMLAEVRRLFASSQGYDTTSVQQLLDRTLALQNPCLEASFWRGLCRLREGDPGKALASFQTARGGQEGQESSLLESRPKAETPNPGPSAKVSPYIDPPLYLGSLLLRQGQAKEALRYLTEANRIDGNCPFVVLQLGSAMVRAGGDAQLAVRALQRALGPRGFGMWAATPQRAWVEGFPENRSIIRKLAAKHPFTCPLWGADLHALMRQGNTALGQGLYRLGQYKEAGDIFHKLMQEGAPSLPVLRGLGLALARQGQYDEAFKHLRIAHEMEDSKERITAGYLALCGARGKPTRPEDKAKNVAWAIRLVSQYTAPGDEEWAGLVSAIFTEARDIDQAVDGDDQIYLCEHLLSVTATDPQAAEAFNYLAGTHPEAVRPEYAWLYCRAAQVHGLRGEHSLALFARTFEEPERAREFFNRQPWDFDAVELTYLECAAELQPGAFPPALGPEYSTRGENLLLERSSTLGKAGHARHALAAAEVLLRLAPQSTRAMDRLAYLHYTEGRKACAEGRKSGGGREANGEPAGNGEASETPSGLEQAIQYLERWHQQNSQDPLPLVRQAVIYQELDAPERSLEKIRQALALTRETQHADIAFLGVRLILQRGAKEIDGENLNGRQTALELLEDCLRHDPHHTQALWSLAALRFEMGDDAGLAGQAPLMDREEVRDARFHFLGGLSHLAGQDPAGALAACQRTAALVRPEEKGGGGTRAGLVMETAYLAGWAHLLQGDLESAAAELQTPAQASACSAAGHAQALLGKISFSSGQYEEAVRWWKMLDPKKRSAWKFNDTLAGTMFLSALEAYRAGQYSQAADKFREAGRLGMRDRRLGPLITLALVKAGQQAIYQQAPDYAEGARYLEQAVKIGCADMQVPYLLGICYKRLGRIVEARAAFRRIAQPDANLLLQLGLLSFAEKAFPQAEQEFSQSWKMAPASYEASYNLLLTRLCLGQMTACADMIAQVQGLAPRPEEHRFLILLEALLRCLPSKGEPVPLGVAAHHSPLTTHHSPIANGDQDREALLAGMTPVEEERLLAMLGSLGQFEATYPLLRRLAALRAASPAAQEAYLEAALVQARLQMDRGQWEEAKELLSPLSRLAASQGSTKVPPRPAHIALLNMLGCCACMLQDFELGVWYFNAALGKVGNDAWLHQNLALAHEWQGRLDLADTHWNRYLDLLDCPPQQSWVPVPPLPNYLEALAFEGLSRLADVYSKREKWNNALGYLQRAQRLRPGDVDTLERLFHLYNHLKRPEDARRTLRRLREVRPNDPQFDLYELDIREVRSIDDIDRLLADLRRALNRYPNDLRVEERAALTVNNIIPLMARMCDQLTDQANKVMDQMRRLPSYQINWPAVREVMRDLQEEFTKLRRVANRCLGLVNNEDLRRALRDIVARIDRKIELCHSMGG